MATPQKFIKAILRDHYGVPINNADMKFEIDNLARKQAKGTLDDNQEMLAIRIESATGESISALCAKLCN